MPLGLPECKGQHAARDTQAVAGEDQRFSISMSDRTSDINNSLPPANGHVLPFLESDITAGRKFPVKAVVAYPSGSVSPLALEDLSSIQAMIRMELEADEADEADDENDE